MLANVLRQTGAHVKSQAMLYKTLVQTMLLYGCERWVVKDTMMTVLEDFHHRVD